MEGTTTEENINVAGKRSAEVYHTEHIIDDDKKSETPALTAAQIRRFVARIDLRVLPMLGIIYAVSIIDRINVGSRYPEQVSVALTTVDWVSLSSRHGRRPQAWH